MYTLEGHIVELKWDSGDCEGVTYVDLSEIESEAIILKTAIKQFKGYTKDEVEMSKLERELQDMAVHPSEKE